MINDANPLEPVSREEPAGKQTFEFRAPDGSADIHNLLSSLVLASLHGLEMENSLGLAESLYVDQDIHKNEEKYAHLKHLPTSCHESAAALLKKRNVFEKEGVFPGGMIDNIIARLRSYNDENLSEKLFGNMDAIRDLVLKYIHVK